MKFFENQIARQVIDIFPRLFGKEITGPELVFQPTRKDFKGDVTLVVFPLSKVTGLSPEITADRIGNELLTLGDLVAGFTVIKGFLNISIQNSLLLSELEKSLKESVHKPRESSESTSAAPVLVEYSSPNTNKPLHLGHIRNILLGYSVSELLSYTGHKVVKVNIVNDRGIHICKSMLAWKKFGNGETPQSSGLKGDHLVGKYYVEFDRQLKKEVSDLEVEGLSKDEAEDRAPLMQEARQMLRKWEEGDNETIHLWNTMNGWVYEGFDITYRNLGVDFDKIYYESQTYLLGKSIVEKGLEDGILYRKPDNSVWIDLREEGLDEKLLLRSDGTSVYMTQDLGTAVKRFEEYGFERMIYVVGNEQDYHFKVLFLILRKLGYPWADKLYHLSYNMVDLPSGKMKSREGTVVDADELIREMVDEARTMTIQLGKLEDTESDEARELFHTLGMGALKYFILKVDPEKRMLFNPEESIDFNGHTGPFIQYTHARIKSVLRKAGGMNEFDGYDSVPVSGYQSLNDKERDLVKIILKLGETIDEAAERYSPAIVAGYVYELARIFNQFYHEFPIADSTDTVVSKFRLRLSTRCAVIISQTMKILGIRVPERM